jgi:hypothetical protein
MCIVSLFALLFVVVEDLFPVHLKEETDWLLTVSKPWETEDGWK